MNLITEELPLVDRHGYVWGTITRYYNWAERKDDFPKTISAEKSLSGVVFPDFSALLIR